MLGGRTATLTQKLGWRKSQTLEIRGEEVYVAKYEGANIYRWKAPVEALDENTMDGSLRNRWLLYGGLFLAVVGLGILCGGVVGSIRAGGLQPMAAYLWAGAIFAVPGIALLVLFRRCVRHVIWILDRSQGVIVLTVRADHPSGEEVQKFLDLLLGESKRLSREFEEQGLASAEQINTANEIRKFHELYKRNLLTRDEFEEKKRALIQGFLRR